MDNVCRTCMRVIDVSESMVSINDSGLREKLQSCLPELLLDNVVDPKMCNTCSSALSLSFRFKGMCHQVEKTINTHIQNKTMDKERASLNKAELLAMAKHTEPELQPLQMLSDIASQATKATPTNSADQIKSSQSKNNTRVSKDFKNTKKSNQSAGNTDIKVVAAKTPSPKNRQKQAVQKLNSSTDDKRELKPPACSVKIKRKEPVAAKSKKPKATSEIHTATPIKPQKPKDLCVVDAKNSKHIQDSTKDVKNKYKIPRKASTTRKVPAASKTQPPSDTTLQKPLSDLTKAMEQLIKTPEYQKLLKLQSKTEGSSLSIKDKLQNIDLFLKKQSETTPPCVAKRKLQKPTSVRVAKALADIQLDLEEINDGVELQKQISPTVKQENLEPTPKKKDGRSFRKKQPLQVCKVCDKVFKYISHLRVHMRAHVFTKDFVCDLCGKSFTLERYLVSHTALHFTAGNHQCGTCQKYFSSWHVLKKHELTHSGKKPYVCEICHRGFTQRINLETHARIHTGIKEFMCYLCETLFSQKVHLAGHMLTHTKEKPYACELCPKTYSKRKVWADHKELHVRKPHTCQFCYTLHADNDSYKRHMKRHGFKLEHPENINEGKFYNCGICNRCFTSRFSRERHMKVHVKDLIEGIKSRV